MKTTSRSSRRFLHSVVIACCLSGAGLASGATATFTVTPSVISNSYAGLVTLNIGSLTNTETVLVDKYLDANTNNLIDAGDLLVQRLELTDGEAAVFSGVTNACIPGDWNVTNGAISAPLNLQLSGVMQQLSGKYALRLSSPTSRFTPVTNLLTVTNFPYSQSFTGRVVTGAANVSNAVVLLFGFSSAWGVQGPVAGTVANNAGGYTLKAPPGTYALMAFKTNRLTDMRGAALLTLSNGVTFSTNLNLRAGGARTISGRIVDAANTNTGLAGLLVTASSTNNLVGIGFTDTNGNFTIGVTNGVWEVRPEEDQMAARGYVRMVHDTGYPLVDTSTGNVSGVTVALPPVTALIYGVVTNSAGQPMPGAAFGEASNGTNSAPGRADASGRYWLGVVAGDWYGEIDATYSGYPNYVFSSGLGAAGPGGLNVADGDAIEFNFSALLATNHITGNVSETNGTPIEGLSLYAWANIGGIYYHNNDGMTDPDGNYSMNVPNGTWGVAVNCWGGDHSLNNLGNYDCPPTQITVVLNTDSTNNFLIYPAVPLAISTTSLPNGTNGVYYSQPVIATGGQQPYNWSLAAGTLPAGLNLSWDGWIWGTPLGSGTWNFTVRLTDGVSSIVEQPLAITILAATPTLFITTAALPNATNGAAYSQQLQASGGVLPYTWTKTSGQLPTGLNLSTNGLLAGTPMTNGTFNFTANVADSGGHSTNKSLALTVVAPVVPDVLNYYVSKLRAFQQLDATTLILNSNAGPCQARVGLIQSSLDAVAIANVTLPTGAVRGLPLGGTGIELTSVEKFSDEAALDAAYPVGSYTFALYGTRDGLKYPVLNLPAAAYPAAPRISNFIAGQSINPANPFTLQWDAIAGATTNDLLWLVIYNTNGVPIFTTPHPALDMAGALRGTATSWLVPTNIFQISQSYVGTLAYFKLTGVNTAAYPGATGLTVLGAQTWFPLAARSPVPTLSNPERINPNVFRFTVNGLAGQNYTIQASSNLVNWNSIRTTNAPADVFTLQLNQATNSRSAYRLRVEP